MPTGCFRWRLYRAVLLGLRRLAFHDVQWLFVGVCVTLTVVSILAAVLVRHAAWRRWYVVMAVAQGLLTLLAVQALSTLTGWQKAELFAVAAGTVLLMLGHLGWRREHEREDDLVSFGLGLGSLLVGGALTIAVLYHRSAPEFSWPDELGLLTGGLILMASGFVLQIKSTTLAGSGDDDDLRRDASDVRPWHVGAGANSGTVVGRRGRTDLDGRAGFGRVPRPPADIAGPGEEPRRRVSGAELAVRARFLHAFPHAQGPFAAGRGGEIRRPVLAWGWQSRT